VLSLLRLCNGLLLQGASPHFLWELEQSLLQHFAVPSSTDLQLPGGCPSLLALLAQQQELAQAVSGHEDGLDVGPHTYEAVLNVVGRVLANVRHSTHAQQQLDAAGRHRWC
jgi:hypothetical protein